MTPRVAVVVVTEDADVIADLIRVGMAALAAFPVASTDAVAGMRRDRVLGIGAAFVAEIDPEDVAE